MEDTRRRPRGLLQRDFLVRASRTGQVWTCCGLPRRERSAPPASARPLRSLGCDRTPALTLARLGVSAAGLQSFGEGDFEPPCAPLSLGTGMAPPDTLAPPPPASFENTICLHVGHSMLFTRHFSFGVLCCLLHRPFCSFLETTVPPSNSTFTINRRYWLFPEV